MAAAPKDRSADYLYCASTKLETAREEKAALRRLMVDELIAIAVDPAAPIFRRAIAAQLACKPGDDTNKSSPRLVARLLAAFPVKAVPLNNAMIDLALKGVHPFYLTLPVIWSRWWHSGAAANVSTERLPLAEIEDGVPLYALDKHTAVGKQAIANLTRQNERVAHCLTKWVPQARRLDVAGIAVFYADGELVDRRLGWSAGRLLARAGFIADMAEVGCSMDGADEVLGSVRENIAHLNDLRRAALGR